ncbi:MAG TPA: chorismate mutase [Rhodospirillaceae bacterium]|nr:chorismate mutase [Rhodospirillaceae bacterium]
MTECRDLAEVRRNIDRLDEAIVGLLAERAGFVSQAARFKDEEQAVVVPERIEAIISRVRHLATDRGCDADLMEALYRGMIDAFIAYERGVWRAAHPKR